MFNRWFLTNDIPLNLCIQYHHNIWLVLLSYLIAAFAAYTAFHLIARVHAAAASASRLAWLVTAGFSMGLGIWAMHFVAMLAVQIAIPLNYDIVLTMLSAGFAVVASTAAFTIIADGAPGGRRLLLAGVVLGSGVGLMHYSGMAALRMPARLYYDPRIFALSVVVAVVFSTAALFAISYLPRLVNGRLSVSRLIGSGVMGLAIVLMHYTGMFATVFYPQADADSAGALFDPSVMAVVIAFSTSVIIGLALISALFDHRAATAEAGQAESEGLLRNVIDNSGDGILVIDGQGRVQICNPAAARLLGGPSEALVGQSVLALIPGFAGADGALVIGRGETSVHGPGTEEQPVEYVVTEMRHAGQPMSICVLRDVTMQKQAEESQRAAVEKAEQAARAKSEFLALISHEIRTPMNGVVGMAGLLLNSKLNTEQREHVQTIIDSGDSLISILNDILDFSKIEAERLELEEMDFDLVQVVDSVLFLLSARAHGKGIELGASLGFDVPRMLRGDPSRLRQILHNLVGNAIKFTERGGCGVAVSLVETSPTSAKLLIEVRDTGIGIAPENRDRLFERFSQVDASTTRRYGGTGLGLAISKRLVDIMGGEIGVDSEVGRGSTFWFTVPFGYAEAPFWDNRLVIAQALRNRRILVVDDNDVNRRVFEKQLAGPGVMVVSAPNGAAALEALADATRNGQPFDAAIVDHMMPEMDGVDLARRIRAQPEYRTLGLVLCSSSGLFTNGHSAKEYGFDVFLSKPVPQTTLLEQLAGLWRAETAVVAAPAATPPTRPAWEDTIGPPMRILVVEDHEINQRLVRALLSQAGHHIDIAANGIEAVEAVRNRPYDVVLMDVQMPEMDGYQATHRIREMTSEAARIPIIGMTANAMKGDREKCLDAGMDDYIAKPIKTAELFEKLEQWGRGEAAAGESERG